MSARNPRAPTTRADEVRRQAVQMVYLGVCERSTPNMGRSDQDRTYPHLVRRVQAVSGWDSLSDFLAANPEHVWNDPSANEFVVEIDKALYESILDGSFPLHHGVGQQPKWQQRVAASGAAKEWGSFESWSDPASLWQADVEMRDTRLTWEFYIGDPDAGGTHVAKEQLDEGSGGGYEVRNILQYNPDGSRSTMSANDQYTYLNGARFSFDFVNGVTSIEISTVMTANGAGVITMGQTRDFKTRGPAGETEYVVELFRRRVYPA